MHPRSRERGNAKSVLELTAFYHPCHRGTGPEFDFKVVESTEDRCVCRATKCAWHERAKELGMKWDYCTSGHTSWGKGCVASLNPDFDFRLTKNMQRGDTYCEWIIEKK